ncbi:MAG: endonuclease/exonuclease/phosphatase family protein [Proteobacteria bacterium]|nr:endonuclease/exonuclease/phosphatase family protein [Pseudomonadota bacterium]
MSKSLVVAIFMALAFKSSAEESCSYLCKSIPDANNVLTSWGLAPKKVLNAESIKVLVWNLYKERKASFKSEYSNLSKNKDLILLQEQSLESENLKIFNQSSRFYWHHATQFFMKDRIRTGVGTAARVLSLDAEYLRTKILEPYVKSPKLIIVSYYLLSDAQRLMVLNIHGMNARGLEGLKSQIDESLALIKRHEGPVLFAGDFNTKNLERLKYLDSSLEALGLDRARLPNGASEKSLDHVYTRYLDVQNLQYINSPGSDHPAITLIIKSQY